MPLHRHSIGPFTFDAVRGEIQLQREELEILVRPAVDGSGVRRIGRRGRPFRVETWRYDRSFASAELLLQQYLRLIELDPQPVVKNSVTLGDLYQVLDVEKNSIAPVTTAVGTIVANPQALLIARWTLLPMPRSEFVRTT